MLTERDSASGAAIAQYRAVRMALAAASPPGPPPMIARSSCRGGGREGAAGQRGVSGGSGACPASTPRDQRLRPQASCAASSPQ